MPVNISNIYDNYNKAKLIAKQIDDKLEKHSDLVQLVEKKLKGGKRKSPKKMSGGKRKSPKKMSGEKRKSPKKMSGGKRKSPKKMSGGKSKSKSLKKSPKQSGGLKRRSYYYQRTRQLHGEQGPVIAKCPRGKKMAKNGHCFKKRKSIKPKKI